MTSFSKCPGTIISSLLMRLLCFNNTLPCCPYDHLTHYFDPTCNLYLRLHLLQTWLLSAPLITQQRLSSSYTCFKSAVSKLPGLWLFSGVTQFWPCLPMAEGINSASVSVPWSLPGCQGRGGRQAALNSFRSENKPRPSQSTQTFQ